MLKVCEEMPSVTKSAVGGNRKKDAPCQRASVGMIRLMTVVIFCTVCKEVGLRNCTINWTMLAVGAPMNTFSLDVYKAWKTYVRILLKVWIVEEYMPSNSLQTYLKHSA